MASDPLHSTSLAEGELAFSGEDDNNSEVKCQVTPLRKASKQVGGAGKLDTVGICMWGL